MSAALAARPSTEIGVLGPHWAWGRDLALLGFLAPIAALGAWVPLSALLLFGGIAAVTGFPLGLLAARALDRLRGHVPLPLLGLLMATLAATWGMGVGGILVLLGDHFSVLVFGVFLPGGLVAVCWLPYTMARVLGKPTWPILIAALVLASSWRFIAPLFVASFL